MAKKPTYEELENRIKAFEKAESDWHIVKEQNQIEAELRESKERFSALSNASFEAIFFSKKGICLDQNKTAEKMFGYSVEDAVGRQGMEWIVPEDREQVKNNMLSNYEKPYQVTALRKNGTTFPAEIQARMVNVGGKELRVTALRDITERKQAEDAQQESRERYKSLTNNLNIGVYRNSFGSKGKFIEANTALLEMFGFSDREEFFKLSVSDLYANPSDRAKFIAKMLKKDQVRNEELQLQKIDGTLFIGSISAVVIKDGKGKVRYYDGIVEDITEQKLKEKKLKKSEQQYRDLFNSTTDLIYTQDMDGRFISVNPAMQNLFGYNKEELLGHRPSDFMELKLQTGFKERYLEKVKEQGYHEGIACYYNKIGEKFYIEYKSFLIKPDDGELYISGMGRDVTEKVLSEKKLKTLQEQIAQFQRMEAIGTLAGGIAHDFNNILFPIMGYTEMLMKDVDENSTSQKRLAKIYTSAIRARELVKQILTFSRQGNNEFKLIEIQPVVKEVLKLIRSTIPTTIEIKSHIQTSCNTIQADPTQIHQIIMNLAINAYHAMEDSGGKLKVTLEEVELVESDLLNLEMESGAFACLTISDTGKGMDKELTRKIFDPFFTTKELGKGTGMGLSIVHGIVADMKGGIQVHSEPEKGTQFFVYLPIVSNMKKQQIPNAKAAMQGGTEHILLLDDEEAIIEMEKEMLERLGYQVTSHTNSVEALEDFCNNTDKFDMVITDMAMPDMSGDKLSAELIKIRPDIPILLCTGFSETISDEKAASLGIKGFLLKPIGMNDFSRKIRQVLDFY